nr:type VI secretion protein [Stutzerimonas stutzeri]
MPTRIQGGSRVLARYCALVLFAASLALAGCSGNYKFNDDEYRPLGDPQVSARGN